MFSKFLITIFLNISLIVAMQEQYAKKVLLLTDIASKQIADKLVENIKSNKSLNWFESKVLDENSQNKIIDSLFKYYSNLMWAIYKNQISFVPLIEHESKLHAIAISKDSRFIITGSCDRTVKIWDTRTMSCTQTLKCQRKILNVFISDDNKIIVASSLDGNVTVWNRKTSKIIKILHLNSQIILSLSNNCKILFTKNFRNNKIAIYNLKNEEYTKIFKLSNKFFNAKMIKISQDNNIIVIGLRNGKIKIFDACNKKLINSFICDNTNINLIAISNNNKIINNINNFIVTSSNNNIIQIWDTTGKCIDTLTLQEEYKQYFYTLKINDISISADNKLIIITTNNDILYFWDWQNNFVYILNLSNNIPYDFSERSLAISKNGKFIVKSNTDYTATVLYLPNKKLKDIINDFKQYFGHISKTKDSFATKSLCIVN